MDDGIMREDVYRHKDAIKEYIKSLVAGVEFPEVSHTEEQLIDDTDIGPCASVYLCLG